jgi:3-mercaptopyruvate sulfurtransferase SseA
MLGAAGFSDVSVLRGGMEQWNRDGRPIAYNQATELAR